MIHGIELKESILNELSNMRIDFYLTGSRFFGGFSAESDYDFYAQHDKPTQVKLINMGFKILLMNTSGYEYHDNNCAVILRKQNVDVQLVKSIELKTMAQKIMTHLNHYFTPRPKSERRHMWNAIYHAIDPQSVK